MSSTPRSVLALLVVAGLVGCTDRTPDSAVPAPVRPERLEVYVAVGASESVGVGADAPARDAWPQVFFRDTLPSGTELINVAVSGATVSGALANQLPLALEAKPDLVTVWLNVNDLAYRAPAATYERELQQLVHELRRDGQTVVLVANTPPLDRLPVVRRWGLTEGEVNQRVAAYNAAIARVVAAEGAVLVDLHAAGLAARAAGDEAALISGDGFHPSTRGHAEVAKQFALAYKPTAPADVPAP